MRTLNPEVKRQAIEFTARFGFITRDIFFKHLCPYKHTQRYRTWRELIDQRWLIPHNSERKSAYLSRKSRLSYAPTAVAARSQYFIEHDAIAAVIALELCRLNIVKRFWTEPEMARSIWDVYSILGSNHADKIPDLVLDLNGSCGNLRIALEIERTMKSKQRYDVAALSYLGMKNVDLVIYGCAGKKLSDRIRTAFHGEAFSKSYKAPAVFLLEDFALNGFKADIIYNGQRFAFIEFLSKALKVNLSDEPADKQRTVVRANDDAKKEAG